MNTPVSFELAKLLKEKKFGLNDDDYIQLSRWYDKKSKYFENDIYVSKKLNKSPNHLGADTINDFEANLSFIDNSLDKLYLAPTIAEVVMWLYKRYKIWISVYEYKDHAADANDDDVFRTSYTKIKEFNCPIQAYEAAIKHVLNELI